MLFGLEQGPGNSVELHSCLVCYKPEWLQAVCPSRMLAQAHRSAGMLLCADKTHVLCLGATWNA
jgi:hypothetical protein